MKLTVMHFLHEDDGSALLEMAAALTMMLSLLFGIMGFSRVLYIASFVEYAAHEGSRYAMVRGSSFNGKSCATTTSANCTASIANITAAIATSAPPGVDTSSPLTVTPTWPGTTPDGSACANSSGNNSPGCLVVVKVTYSTGYSLPFMPAGAITLKSQSAVTIAQ